MYMQLNRYGYAMPAASSLQQALNRRLMEDMLQKTYEAIGKGFMDLVLDDFTKDLMAKCFTDNEIKSKGAPAGGAGRRHLCNRQQQERKR